MTDRFDNPQARTLALLGSAGRALAVTPNDSTDLAFTGRALWVGVGGNISVILDEDTAAVTFVAVPSGTLLPVRVRRVRSTGTTASSLVVVD